MDKFQDYTDDLNVHRDDVFMRMFKQTLEGDCKKWFKGLSVVSISSFWDLHDLSLSKWASIPQDMRLPKIHTLNQQEDNFEMHSL